MPSTAIGPITYLQVDRELDVTFIGSGVTYTFIGVEPEIHEEFRRSPAKGRFFNNRIRGRYPYRRWSEVRQRSPQLPARGPAPSTPH